MVTPSEMKLLYFPPAPPKASVSLPQEGLGTPTGGDAQREPGSSKDRLACAPGGKD